MSAEPQKKRGPRVRPDRAGAGYSVEDLARRWRIGPDRIRGMITRGELPALNTSDSSVKRPRYIILPEAVAAWERSKQTGTAEPKAAPRRRRQPTVRDYYPD